MGPRFQNRQAAGEALAKALLRLQLNDPVVIALPRGGVPVALPIASALNAPLDLVLVRKIGAPGHEELAMGAAVDGLHPDAVWNETVVRQFGVGEAEQARALGEKLAEIATRRKRYLGARLPVPLDGRDAVVVDDGVATGATTRAALLAIRRRKPASITLAIPVAPAEVLEDLRQDVDNLICLATPSPFIAVGAHYVDFRQTSDDEVAQAIAAQDHGKELP
jgi:putative phosphoribosyl transferase